MSWIVGRFDLVGYPKRWLVVASKMDRDEVNFWKETLLKKIKSRRKRVLGYRFYVDTLG